MAKARRKAASSAASSPAAAAPGKRLPTELERLRLVEVPGAPGSPYKVLATVDGAVPDTAQRVAMAKRAIELASQCAYVQTRAIREQQEQQQGKQSTQPTEEPMMTKELDAAAEAGVLPDPKDVQKAFDISRKEIAKREAAEKKAAAEKAKAEEAARKKAAKQRQARKGVDVTPKTSGVAKLARDAGPGGQHKAAVATAKAAKGGRPAKAEDPNQQYAVLKDNTRSGHMKTFMLEATRLKKFTRAQLVAATKSKVTADRAERYFDYCLYKKLLKAA